MIKRYEQLELLICVDMNATVTVYDLQDLS